MEAPDVLRRARELGVQFKVECGRLICRAPARLLTPQLRSEVTAHRDQLVQILEWEQNGASEFEFEALAGRVCLWRIPSPDGTGRYMVAGPDHDLRDQYADAVALFDETHRDQVRDGRTSDADGGLPF